MSKFTKEVDPVIKDMFELEKYTPDGFTCRRGDDCLVFYRLEFDEVAQFPKIL